MTRLAIVIVSFNAREDLASTLAVVDDGAARHPARNRRRRQRLDRWRAGAGPRRFPEVRVIDAGGNLGFARANNLGIRSTSSELVLLLNPDTIAPAGAIDRLVARLDQQPDVAVVGPAPRRRAGARGAVVRPR